jgi:Pro-kumamolisin, activation domain/Bacterial Ig-like domain (group 3)/Immunoglobulin domain/Domain of unknown function (DUF5011)/Viral BACON domain
MNCPQRKPRKTRFFAPLTLLTVLLLAGARPVLGAPLKQLHGHVPEITRKLTALGRLPATNELHLAIGVPLRDPAGLDKFLADVYDPASSNYRHFLTPTEFAARFSATEADYAAVKNFALTNGFKITGEHGNRLLLDVTAKAAEVERAFHFNLKKFKHPKENREFFAPDAEPTVDLGLAVVDVQGLSDYSRPQPRSHQVDLKMSAPRNGSAPDGSSYFGNDFRNAYVPGTVLTGAGQQVGLLQFDGFYAADIAKYAQQTGSGRTNIPVQAVLLDGVSGTPGYSGISGANGEVSLDIEMAMAMAPGLAKIVVFEGNLQNSILNAMAASNTVKNLSSSWGWRGGPSTTTDNIFKTLAAQGQSFFNASGDSCAFTVGASSVNGVDNTSIPNAPSSCPYITQVGGTTLTTGGGATYSSESVWNWGNSIGSQYNGVGSSGGVSSYYSIPSWQTNVSMTANLGSTTQRNIPDVALTADGCYVYSGNGSAGSYGGTSCAAPLWAGFMALVNQQAVANGNPTAGFINPAIYAIGKGQNPGYSYAACFHDTTVGNNYWSNSLAQYPAVAGYDLCTGWGTPNGQNLIDALVGPADVLGITPQSGFTAAGLSGGPFSPSSQVFTLTNSGASSLSWSLINTSVWLNVSASSGTLVAAGQTTVNASLNSTANSLAVGTYAATIVFSNQTSDVQQSRQFTLQISDPLALLTTSGFTTYGPPGGPFNPGSQSVVFTNLSANAVAWSLINTSSWLSVSASSGSIGGNSSLSVTVSTNSATAGLAAGIYSATLVLSNQFSHFIQSLACTATVNTNLVQNGGFETADLTGWIFTGTLGISGNGSANYIATTGDRYVSPHGGLYALALGDTKIDTLTQTLSTTPGQTYLFSFWLKNSGSGTTEIFQAAWNNTNVYAITNPPTMAWTSLKYIVTATGNNTTLQFAAENDPAYFGLDDISVIPVNPPSITQQPVSQTNLVGSNVTFTAAASGTAPLAYQWRTNGVKLVNGTIVSGATSNVLTLTGISLTNAGNYTLVVTNAYGSVTSSVASLTVVLPPSFTGNVTNRTIECGANTNNFSIITVGTPLLGIQWSLDGSPVTGATNASFGLTNLLSPSHTVTVTVTNLYGSVSSNATLTVQDTHPPIITILGANPLTNELGSAFVDPGATANDLCAGTLSVVTNNAVNISVVGTNILKYTATDGFSSATNTRTVVVRDTTPPTISWSFTNLVLAANSNCVAVMPDVTGTNFILATDLSGVLTITQSPTNNAVLPFGTNVVVITVADASTNKSFSTNRIVVQDQTAPVILTQPQNQTNSVGAGAGFTVVATACTPLSFQWYFATNALPSRTNSTLTLTNLAVGNAGNYSVVVMANGGSVTSSVVALTVNSFSTTVAIVSSSNPTGFQDSLNFTATLSPTNATGTLQFLTNGAVFDLEPLIAGSATSTNLSTLPRGTNLVTTIYSGDSTYLPATNSLAQVVTNHPPQVAPVFYTLVAGLNLNIAVADLATNWSDADGDKLFIAAISTSTNGVTVTNAPPTLFYANANYVNDQFICAITDNFGDTNWQAINVTIVPQTNATPAITKVASQLSGGLNLGLSGGYGSTYVLESTTDFLSGVWLPVATNTLGLDGKWQFTDFDATNFPARFYRLKRVQ